MERAILLFRGEERETEPSDDASPLLEFGSFFVEVGARELLQLRESSCGGNLIWGLFFIQFHHRYLASGLETTSWLL